FFFLADPALAQLYPLSLHDALPISGSTYRTSRDSATIRVLETGLPARGDEPAELVEEGGRRELGTRTAISAPVIVGGRLWGALTDRKSTRLNSSHVAISYAVFCLKK